MDEIRSAIELCGQGGLDMQIDKNASNKKVMMQESTKIADIVTDLDNILATWKQGMISTIELADLLKERSAELATAATLYKIAELACQLEQKYGKE